jgi:hypothetical protein
VRAELEDTAIEVSCVMPALVNTELTSGLPLSRGVKKVEPEDVANAIVDALEYPKFDVWVPKISAGIFKVMTLMPRRGREAVAKALNADKVLAQPNAAERAAYEERASHSEPSREPGTVADPEPSETAAS